MNLTIELGKVKDIDELEKLYDDLNDSLAEGVNYPGWKKGVYPVRQNAVEGIENGNLFVAKNDGKIIGSIILNHKPEGGYAQAKWLIEANYSEVIVIHTFAVHPDYLKCGVGKALMDFSIQHGIQNQAKSIRLDVYEGNSPAIRLYEKYKFQYIDTVDLGYGKYGLNWFKLFEKLL